MLEFAMIYFVYNAAARRAKNHADSIKSKMRMHRGKRREMYTLRTMTNERHVLTVACFRRKKKKLMALYSSKRLCLTDHRLLLQAKKRL